MKTKRNKYEWPIRLAELNLMIQFAKQQPSYRDAAYFVEYLEYSFRGVVNPYAWKRIDTIREHFDKMWMKEKREYWNKTLHRICTKQREEIEELRSKLSKYEKE